MLFNSYEFVFLFLPIVLAGYYFWAAFGNKKAEIWLCVSSLAFYFYWSPSFTILLAASISFNFFMGLILQNRHARQQSMRGALIFGVGANLSLLFLFKYALPLLKWLAGLGIIGNLPIENVVLPLGISFFTFTQIGYLIDCESGISETKSPIDYVLFVTFFPHLIAGPILHHREMMPQFADPKTYRFDPENLVVGGSMFAIGLAKKVLLAETFAKPVSDVYLKLDYADIPALWVCFLSYSLQLYFDFSGYSDMAVGLARMFGIKFPANFNSPYKSTSIIDFWQRWHMTLTRYLNLYIYNPIALSVTRARLNRGYPTRNAVKTIPGFLHLLAMPTAVTMILAGVWHGAGFQYLCFGVLHASYLVINHAWRTFGPRRAEASSRWGQAATLATYWLLTYAAVLAAEIMFRSNSAGEAVETYGRLLGFRVTESQGTMDVLMGTTGKKFLAVLSGFAVILLAPNSNQILKNYAPVLGKIKQEGRFNFHISFSPNYLWGGLIGLLMVLSVIQLGNPSEFLYFQF